MRNLSAKQKKALKEWRETNHADSIFTYDMDTETYDRIFNMNPHETFEANANRYMWDLKYAEDE